MGQTCVCVLGGGGGGGGAEDQFDAISLVSNTTDFENLCDDVEYLILSLSSSKSNTLILRSERAG